MMLNDGVYMFPNLLCTGVVPFNSVGVSGIGAGMGGLKAAGGGYTGTGRHWFSLLYGLVKKTCCIVGVTIGVDWQSGDACT